VLGLQLARPGFSRLFFFKDRDGADELPVGGKPWELTFSREEGYRRAQDAKERDLQAELCELGAEGEWRTLKEWWRPKAEGGVGVNDDALREALTALILAGDFEYKEGPPGRSKAAKCWRRVVAASSATGSPWHPVAPVAQLAIVGTGATLPPAPVGGGAEDVAPPTAVPPIGHASSSDPWDIPAWA
jgi:hypothetical protein